MLTYIHFTDEQKQRANSVDIAEFLRSQGEQLIRSGREWRWKRHDSVCIKGNEWYRHSAKEGGGAVSFVQTFFNKSYPEAVSMLLNGESGLEVQAISRKPKIAERKPFKLPPANNNMHRVYAYLIKQRFIDSDVITHFAKAHTIYEDSEHHNAVFVGLDKNGTAKHAHRKSTYSEGKSFRGNVEGSLPEYSFHYKGTSEKLFVFESAIDMLSYITLHKDNWQEHSYVALDGVCDHALLYQLSQNNHLRNVVLCLDNDEAGIEARYRLTEDLKSKDYSIDYSISKNKDWNEDLKAQNGITPLLSVPHDRILLYQWTATQLNERYLNNDKELILQICDCLKIAKDGTDSVIQRNALIKLSELSISAGAKLMVRLEQLNIEIEQAHFYLKTLLYSNYQPHHDKGGLKSKLHDLELAVNSVIKELKSLPTKSKAEIKERVNKFLELTKMAIRVHTCLELAERKLMQEQKQTQGRFAIKM